MVYSYIGMGKPLALFNRTLKLYSAKYRAEHGGTMPLLVPGGIYAGNLSAAATFAVENDMKLYVNVDDLLTKSDIIFLFLNDNSMSRIATTLSRYPVKGKIFCHFNQLFMARTLDFNSRNTYACIHIPYFEKAADGSDAFNRIIVEGYGKQLENMGFAFDELGIRCSFINEDEMIMYRMALSLNSDMKRYLERESQRMLKYALASDRDLCEDMMRIATSSAELLNSETISLPDNNNLISEQIRVMKNAGMESMSKIYSSFLDLIHKQ